MGKFRGGSAEKRLSPIFEAAARQHITSQPGMRERTIVNPRNTPRYRSPNYHSGGRRRVALGMAAALTVGGFLVAKEKPELIADQKLCATTAVCRDKFPSKDLPWPVTTGAQLQSPIPPHAMVDDLVNYRLSVGKLFCIRHPVKKPKANAKIDPKTDPCKNEKSTEKDIGIGVTLNPKEIDPEKLKLLSANKPEEVSVGGYVLQLLQGASANKATKQACENDLDALIENARAHAYILAGGDEQMARNIRLAPSAYGAPEEEYNTTRHLGLVYAISKEGAPMDPRDRGANIIKLDCVADGR